MDEYQLHLCPICGGCGLIYPAAVMCGRCHGTGHPIDVADARASLDPSQDEAPMQVDGVDQAA